MMKSAAAGSEVGSSDRETRAARGEDAPALLRRITELEQQIAAWEARWRRHEERLRIQTVLIHAQAAALAELSIPIIPIHDQVFVVPLIGTMDEHRAELVITTLLEGVTAHKARVAILDITGVSGVNARVAGAFVRAASAIQLVGARLLLTGMRPEVARALVEIGADLTGIIARGTLQSGIVHALEEIGGASPRLTPRRT